MTRNKKRQLEQALGEKIYTYKQVFGRYERTKAYQRAYQEEMQRIDLVRQIKQLRAKRRLTQRAVAVKSGMTQSVIARIESGEHAISLDTLGKIAHALGKKVSLV